MRGSETFRQGGENPARAPSTIPPLSPSLAPRRLVAPHTTPSDERLKCKSVFWLVPGCCQHVFLLSVAIDWGLVSPLCRDCSGIIDRPVTLLNQIMETYWFFLFSHSLFSSLFFHRGSVGSYTLGMTESKSKGTVDNDEDLVTCLDLWVAPATSEEGKKSRQVAVLGDKKSRKGESVHRSINQSINQQNF